MSSSAVSGGHHARWQEMQAQAQTTRAATPGASAPSSDLTDMLAGADPSQASAPPPPSTGWPSHGRSNTASAASTQSASTQPGTTQAGSTPIGSAASALVSGVQSMLTSLQSELSGGAATPSAAASTGTAPGIASSSTASSGSPASGTASAGSATTDAASTLSQIMQMLQAYGAQSSVTSASTSMSSVLTA